MGTACMGSGDWCNRVTAPSGESFCRPQWLMLDESWWVNGWARNASFAGATVLWQSVGTTSHAIISLNCGY
jgi:hypothetical protein